MWSLEKERSLESQSLVFDVFDREAKKWASSGCARTAAAGC
ncbi:MAG: hypothetical protein ACLR06_02945 [Christensenellaceae bacterium]